ncbi:hypothetical protein [Hamadaea tsunoensis]|uniref:hypothetical protein n=1 Tax=Hamadaea tsunoensis TaxID=53368 RepID=UPI000419642C|nr:hypothetical protein [Hamadaea tsunoensis]
MRWSTLVMIGIVLLVAATAARSHPEPTQAPPTAKPATSLCEQFETRESCREIAVDGRTWRYTLQQPAAPTSDAVVLDLGGPGTSALSGSFNLAGLPDVLPDLMRRFNVIIVEEPWVTTPVTDGCDQSLSAFYHDIRNGDRSAAGPVRSSCGLGAASSPWGFSPSTYSDVIRAIAGRHQLSLKGFVGHSFGSVRLSYGKDLGFAWAVLGRPFPYTAGLTELIREQSTVLTRLQRKLERTEPGPLPPAGDERSIPTTEFDRLSAIVELGYLDDTMAARLGKRVIDGSDTESIGLMSDTLWSRYGTESMSTRTLAFWDEVCATTGPAKPPADASPLRTLLTNRYATCTSPATYRPTLPAGLRLCVVDSPDDPVAPQSLVRKTFPPGAAITYNTTTVGSHTSMAGLDDCVEAVSGTS